MTLTIERTFRVSLGEFTLDSLEAQGGSADLSEAMVDAIRHYLEDKPANRLAWRYPRARPGNGGSGRGRTAHVRVEEPLWKAFEHEAELQGVPVEELARHALLYYLADVDAGRLTPGD